MIFHFELDFYKWLSGKKWLASHVLISISFFCGANFDLSIKKQLTHYEVFTLRHLHLTILPAQNHDRLHPQIEPHHHERQNSNQHDQH